MKIVFLIAFMANLVFAFSQESKKGYYNEKYRPQLHFSPEKNWTNDPNGLVYLNGEYHLFYQYNPFGNNWGHMSWGHAVSKDLVSWKHLPLALAEEGNTMIFSGACVIDKNNSSGFATKPGQVPIVAIYTAFITPDSAKPENTMQNQHIAYSIDNGRTWKKYKNNPVLDLHVKDFRDPNVFWYAKDKKWVMSVVLPNEHIVQFYSSTDLKKWAHLSDFGNAGDTRGLWECPALLQVPVKGKTNESKWVLLNSVAPIMQYFIGVFDGKEFHNENPAGQVLRPDYGADFYAGITYNNLPAGQSPVLIGWVANWSYAGATPTSPWRGAMSLPRKLSVEKLNGIWTLLQQPVNALQKYRDKFTELQNVQVNGVKSLPILSQLMEIDITLKPGKHDSCGIRLAVGNGKYFTIGYTKNAQQLYIDRSNSGDTNFHPAFASWLKAKATLALKDDKIRLHIFFDKSIIEIFGNDGEVVMTEQIFPEETGNGLELISKTGNSVFESVKIWQLKSSWR